MTTPTSRPRVLVVDDEEGIREYLRILFQHAGWLVRTASDGRHALEALRSEPVDLVVLDLMMPVVDGWAVIAEIQRDPLLAAIPVLILSALPDRAPDGAAAILVKPSTRAELLGTASRLIGRDRRVAPRFTACFDVETLGDEGPVRTTTFDLSRGGLSFASPVATAIGQRLTVTLDLLAHGAVIADAEVRYVATAPDGWRVGARFVTVRANAEALESTLAALAAARK